MRHSDFRGLEKNAQTFDEEFEGLSARSVDDHYNYPFSPNSSSEFLTDGSSRQQQHSLFSFVAPKQKKKKKNKDSAAANKLEEEAELPIVEEKPPQTRGRLQSREYSDIQFDMEPEDDKGKSKNEGKLDFSSQNKKQQSFAAFSYSSSSNSP
jgi:hypothetical protein